MRKFIVRFWTRRVVNLIDRMVVAAATRGGFAHGPEWTEYRRQMDALRAACLGAEKPERK